MSETEEPTRDERGNEHHPAFGMVQVARLTGSHGETLFDSEVQHRDFVALRIYSATRRRDLNRDWIHAGTTPMTEVRMSESQWAQMVSSVNSSGTPVTIHFTDGGEGREFGETPGIPFAPRLALSMAETRDAASRVFARAKAALAKYKDHKTAANLRDLEHAFDAAEPNVEYAAKTLAEYTEDVVEKAKADIEAAVDTRARQLGIDPSTVVIELNETRQIGR